MKHLARDEAQRTGTTSHDACSLCSSTTLAQATISPRKQ